MWNIAYENSIEEQKMFLKNCKAYSFKDLVWKEVALKPSILQFDSLFYFFSTEHKFDKAFCMK